MLREQIALLAADLGQQLLDNHWLMTTAESCTGGGVSHAITAIPGSSDWFEMGFVTYSNRAKQLLLGVDQQTLESYGAVSQQVVLQMAQGALKVSNADFAVALTGIAGPSGGTASKPVGTVWIGWARRDESAENSCCYHFSGDRLDVRDQSIAAALQGLIAMISAKQKPIE